MKKSILLLFFLSPIVTSFAQNTFPEEGNVGIGTLSPNALLSINPFINYEGSLLQMGSQISSNKRLFNFDEGATSPYVSQSIYSTNGSLRFSFQASDINTSLSLFRKNETKIFEVSRSDGGGSYLSMPKIDSKIIIGEDASYLENEGHKLIVRHGSALVEGNIIVNSNIGIGTNSFADEDINYRLSVNGKIRATAVKVYTNWADYVFEKDYKLPSLFEVEKYIHDNGHLKDIPSGKEVEEKGIELGEMNKLLLQKIEELTLYVIELNKEITVLKKNN